MPKLTAKISTNLSVNLTIPTVVTNRLLLFFLGFTLTLQAQSTDSLLNQLRTARTDTVRIRLLYELGYTYWLSGNDSLAVYYCSQSAKLAKQVAFLPGEGKARLQLVRIEADRMVDFDGGFTQVDTVLRIAATLKDRHMEAVAYMRKAQLLETNLTRQREIMPLFDKAQGIFTELGEKSWQGTVYGEKAQFFARTGNFSKAIAFFLKARQLQEEANDLAALRSTLPNLGVAYAALRLYEEASTTFDEAERVAKKRNDKVLEAFLLNQRAEILEKQGHYDAALGVLAKAVAIHKATKAAYWLPKTYLRIGRVYIKQKQFDKALTYTQLGDKLFQDVTESDDFLDHLVQINYAKIYLNQHQYQRAITYATGGLTWAAESDPPLLAETSEYHSILAQAYEGIGQLDKALLHYKTYKADSDSLLNQESVQKATASAMNYAFDKQRQQAQLNLQTLTNDKLTQARNFLITISVLTTLLAGFIFWSNRKLKSKNEELVIKNQEIEDALFKGQYIERKRVASELHDNLNTKLAALRWRMEAWDVAEYSEEDRVMHEGMVQMLDDVYSDVRLISHNLLPTELQTHGLASALQKLTDKLNFNPSMQFLLNISGVEKRPTAKIESELYYIALELVNNSIKHSQANQVRIDLDRQPKKIRLTIRDNGVGFSPTSQANGIGMRNITARVETLKGVYKLESSPGNGACIQIEVPS
ncbi:MULTISPECIES: tetratricopeptide repeat protein [unclassified Spirosoma]|uniref:tetratricopeptide repeat-containing sensor histidine kinase n=1 Tax=unclassified Spirosoma TaxID=2621999 RepID=UPI000B24E714|nr:MULTISPECIES: tetratricopeptide repeat protein [unclassified Spirosoma]MBN8826634.1 tetratricopeptide repeat protein [Spirosoma sp.]